VAGKIKTPRKIHKKQIQGNLAHYEVIPVMMVSLVKNCARCGGMHANVLFKSFGKRPGKYTHFAICPTTQEPILMIATPDEPKKGKHAR
jgi:hypothetical protein